VEALVALWRSHRARGEEVFATPLTRARPQPGIAGGVLAGRVVWVDLDEPRALSELRRFAHRPDLVVYSGSGGAHAYWRLARPAEPARIEAANRALADRLGADPASTDRARIMRPLSVAAARGLDLCLLVRLCMRLRMVVWGRR
jgi:hypothetical protein